jgi:TolB protein
MILSWEPVKITDQAPSYWHGWSPDGTTLVDCAEREGNYDVWAIGAHGGKETRLTTDPGLDDGPEYSLDGASIYFNSTRSGRMKIWRMRPDGSGQEQVSFDDYNDWFAHICREMDRIISEMERLSLLSTDRLLKELPPPVRKAPAKRTRARQAPKH